MRTLRLARVAAEAEGLRLRYTARRAAVRTMLGLVALGFMLGALVFCHVAAWAWLCMSWDEPVTALILAGTDLVVAAVLALLVTRSSAGRIETEALALRRRALQDATSASAMSGLVVSLIPLAGRLFRRR